MQSAMAHSVSCQSSNSCSSHVPVSAQCLKAAAVVFVLGASGTFGDIGELAATQLFNNLRHVTRFALDGIGTGPAAKRAVALTISLIEIERHHGNIFALDVLPDV